MEIPPYEKGEVSCRACKKFDSNHCCWKTVSNYGHDCKFFKLKENIERCLPVKEKAND